MKALLISIRPQWVEKILNGIKTLEIRKKFPKDYVGWVYIYCTKGKQTLKGLIAKSWYGLGGYFDYEKLNGKVVARFWCDKVKEFSVDLSSVYDIWQNIKETCLTEEEIINYILGKDYFQGTGYAIHINDLEIFDKPKEISEFWHKTKTRDTVKGYIYSNERLEKAPQSWCHVEI